MHLSVIIPAYNEEMLIGATLEALTEALNGTADLHSKHEIIVVNDASTDRTAEIAKAHGAQVVNVHKRQIAAVRNAGAACATGDYFIFVDADTLISSATLRATLDVLRNGAVGGGCDVRMDGHLPLLGRIYLAVFMLIWRPLRYAAGCYVFCTRAAFNAVGGFDERFFASEEIWISKALKKQGQFTILREYVTTSGRKMRMYPRFRLFVIAIRLLWKGPRGWQQREGLELWYDGRRE